MAKETGLGFTVTIDDSTPTARDISNDVTNFNFATPKAVQNTTGVDKSAMERLLLLADFSIGLNGVFDDATNLSHDVFKTVTSSAVVRTVTLAISGQQLAAEALFTDYALTRAADGSLTWTAPGVLANGTAAAWTTP